MDNEKQPRQIKNYQGLLSIKEASNRLGLSFWTLYAWTRAGRIPYVQLGKRKLFMPHDIENFIKQHRIRSNKQIACTKKELDDNSI